MPNLHTIKTQEEPHPEKRQYRSIPYFWYRKKRRVREIYSNPKSQISNKINLRMKYILTAREGGETGTTVNEKAVP